MSGCFNYGIDLFLTTSATWSSIAALLVDNTYSVDLDDEFIDEGGGTGPVSGEISNTGYSRQNLTGEVVVVDLVNDEVQCDADNINFGNIEAGDQPYAVVTYIWYGADTNSNVITHNLLTDPAVPNGGSYTCNVNAEGVFKYSN